jgi:hypothetical protein
MKAKSSMKCGENGENIEIEMYINGNNGEIKEIIEI